MFDEKNNFLCYIGCYNVSWQCTQMVIITYKNGLFLNFRLEQQLKRDTSGLYINSV